MASVVCIIVAAIREEVALGFAGYALVVGRLVYIIVEGGRWTKDFQSIFRKYDAKLEPATDAPKKETGDVHWQKERVERFFGAPFTWVDPMHELRFEGGGLRYLLWLDDQRQALFLRGDAREPDCSFPAIEVWCHCRRIEETEASGVGPVLLFYASSEKSQDHLRLCITRTPEGWFSVSPHWPSHENATYG